MLIKQRANLLQILAPSGFGQPRVTRRSREEIPSKPGAIHLRTSQIDLINPVRVDNIFQGIRVQYDEVGFFARGHRAHASKS